MSAKLKKLLHFIMKLALLAAGLVVIFNLDNATLDTGRQWIARCRGIFGNNLFADGIACAGPLGFAALGLTLAAALMRRYVRRRGRSMVFWPGAVLLWGVITLLSWLFDWIIRQKGIFLKWVPPMAIALTALLGCTLLFFTLSTQVIAISHMDAESRNARRQALIRRVAVVIGIVLLIARIAIPIAASSLIYYALYAVRDGRPIGWYILAPLLALAALGIWYSVRSDRRKKAKEEQAPSRE